MEARSRSLPARLRHYSRVFRAYSSLHVKTAMEYRTNFFSMTAFMLLNDCMFVLVFYALFSYFGAINGYTAQYAMLVFGIAGMGYGFLAFFAGNARNLATLISEGHLDMYLSTPVDELFHALISKSAFDGVGDILFGILILALFAPSMVLVGVLAGLLGSLVLLGFMIAVGSVAFHMERPKNSTRAAYNVVLSFTSWPIDAYGGPVRLALYAVPFAFAAAVPAHIVSGFSWGALGALALVAVLTLAVAVLLWKWGLRRYESGSVFSVRT